MDLGKKISSVTGLKPASPDPKSGDLSIKPHNQDELLLNINFKLFKLKEFLCLLLWITLIWDKTHNLIMGLSLALQKGAGINHNCWKRTSL